MIHGWFAFGGAGLGTLRGSGNMELAALALSRSELSGSQGPRRRIVGPPFYVAGLDRPAIARAWPADGPERFFLPGPTNDPVCIIFHRPMGVWGRGRR